MCSFRKYKEVYINVSAAIILMFFAFNGDKPILNVHVNLKNASTIL